MASSDARLLSKYLGIAVESLLTLRESVSQNGTIDDLKAFNAIESALEISLSVVMGLDFPASQTGTDWHNYYDGLNYSATTGNVGEWWSILGSVYLVTEIEDWKVTLVGKNGSTILHVAGFTLNRNARVSGEWVERHAPEVLLSRPVAEAMKSLSRRAA